MLTKTIALVLAMTASVFFATPAAYAQLIDISPVNAAAATNTDDDTVVQANSATIKQESETKCEAKVSDDDKVQVGDNINAAANDCDTTQSATVAQANVNEDNDVQVAEATTCQALGILAANLCDNVVIPPPEEPVYCLTILPFNENPAQTLCFEDETSCEESEEIIGREFIIECAPFPEPPEGSLLCERVNGNFTCRPADD